MTANNRPGAGTTSPDAMPMSESIPREPASARDPGEAEPPAGPDEPAARGPDEAFTVEASAAEPIHGLDMRLQWNAVHLRLFGQPAEEHRIGRYLVRGTLGQGAMGRVLRVLDETLGRDVALKVLHETHGRRYEQRLLREAQALARLAHPNVVRVYDVAEIEGRVCMAMELVEGTPLYEWQAEPRRWPDVLEVYLQAARGLAAAHAVGLVHRDFKPANCIVDAQGTVKVLDFGLARGLVGSTGSHAAVELERTDLGERSGSDDRSMGLSRSQRALEQGLTRTGSVLGTPAYMAPEQLLGEPADPRSDQFAFCVAFHEALHGVRPFPGKDAHGILEAIRSRRVAVPLARAGLPAVPRWLHEVLRRGLSVASHQRWPDMQTLCAALERGLARRRRIRGAAIGLVLVAGLGGSLAAAGLLTGERPCEGLREQEMPAWTEADRIAVSEALAAADPMAGAVVRQAVEARLEAHAHAWTEARAEACEATWVRHEAGEQLFARRKACLDERAVHMRAVVDQLARADARTAAFASEAVERLPALEACTDEEALLDDPAPIPEALAEEAAEVQALVARSWALGALGATGDDAHGLEAADRAVAEAEPLADAPTLRLDALHNRGHLLRMARRWQEARHDLEAALELAERIGDSPRSIDVLIELVRLADGEDDASAAMAWLGALRGKLARLEDQPRRVAQRWWLEGLVALRDDRLDEALGAAERAVHEYEQLDPPVVGERVQALVLLGDVLRDRDDHARARDAYEAAQALAEAGGQLPLVAHALFRRGHLHYLEGRPDLARPFLERSLALRDTFYGPAAAASIRTRILLATTFYLEGMVPQAIEQISLARRSLDDRVPLPMRGELLELAGGLHRARLEWDEAIASYREARIAWQSVPSPNLVDLAMIDSNIADCQAAKGEHRTASALYDVAIATLDGVAPTDPQRAYPLLGRGRLRLELGDHEGAARDLRAAQALLRELPPDPPRDAELQRTLERALRPDLATTHTTTPRTGTTTR
jgi:tetratricopeptide (TPR) repeat protein/predicted Ser/Thr protein kinase